MTVAQPFRMYRRISHAEVDFVGEVKLAALVGLLEQAAVEASSSAGLDPAWYTRARRVWIIRRTRLERRIPVGGLDDLRIDTRILDFRRARSLREYVVRRDDPTTESIGASEPVAHAITDWVYCDMDSGRPVSIPDEVRAAFLGDEPPPTLPREPRERLDPEAGDEAGESATAELVVPPSALDHIAHVNNAVYAAWLEDAAFTWFATAGWPLERQLAAGGALRPVTLDVEYLLDARCGDRLTIRSQVARHAAPLPAGATASDDGSEVERAVRSAGGIRLGLRQTITRDDATVVLRARTEWAWRPRPSVVGGIPGR